MSAAHDAHETPAASGAVLFTVGHSNRAIGEFLAILRAYGIEAVADVRKMAGSRRNPQFGEESLRASLEEAGVAYVRMAGLGGFRGAAKSAANAGWRNASFRAYADYMQTPEFARSVEELAALARERRVAVMCAEAVPWRCHRSLIGDAMLVRGFRVEDILSEKASRPHALTAFARVEGTTLTYPPEEGADAGPSAQKSS